MLWKTLLNVQTLTVFCAVFSRPY